jgi:hypothetical protein
VLQNFGFFSRLSQAKSELEGDKKAKIDEWKKETMPVEQWLVEENNKFDAQALSPGARLDVVRKKRKENEVGCVLIFILQTDCVVLHAIHRQTVWYFMVYTDRLYGTSWYTQTDCVVPYAIHRHI